jgi:tetratricopeptide (TPR) repeat protein
VAATQFEQIRKEFPNNPAAAFALGAIARRQGRWKEASAGYAQALALDPRSVFLLVDASGTSLAMRDIAGTDKLLNYAQEVEPENPGVLTAQAASLQAVGKVAEAQALLDRIRPVDGDDGYTAVAVYNAILLHRYDPVIAWLNRQLAKPQNVGNNLGNLEVLLGDVQRHAGNTAAAAASYAKGRDFLLEAARQQPDNADFYGELAQAEAGLGQREAALAHARQAIALMPAARDAYVGPSYEENLARIQARFGDRDDAIKALRHLLTISYGSPPVTRELLQLDPDWENLRNDPRFRALESGGDTASPSSSS